MAEPKKEVFILYKFRNEKEKRTFKMYCAGMGRSMQDVMQHSIEKAHPEPFKTK